MQFAITVVQHAPVKPMQSKLKMMSIELTERDLSRISMRRRMISYRNRARPVIMGLDIQYGKTITFHVANKQGINI